jgi:NlpC/P60 family putative phage cell wall peptidase
LIRGDAIVAEARDWLGTRWLHQASVKGVGTDCIGLVGGVGLRLRVPEALTWAADQRCRGYGRAPDPKVLLTACDAYLDPIPVDAVALGDILVMRFEKDPQHFAIVSRLDPLYIIHAHAQARKVVEHRVDDTWRARIVRAYRFR